MRKGNAIGWRGSHRFQCNTPPAFGGRKRYAPSFKKNSKITLAASTTLSRSRRLRHSFFECIAWSACFDVAEAFIQMAAQSHVLGGKKKAQKGQDNGAFAPPG